MRAPNRICPIKAGRYARIIGFEVIGEFIPVLEIEVIAFYITAVVGEALEKTVVERTTGDSLAAQGFILSNNLPSTNPPARPNDGNAVIAVQRIAVLILEPAVSQIGHGKLDRKSTRLNSSH